MKYGHWCRLREWATMFLQAQHDVAREVSVVRPVHVPWRTAIPVKRLNFPSSGHRMLEGDKWKSDKGEIVMGPTMLNVVVMWHSRCARGQYEMARGWLGRLDDSRATISQQQDDEEQRDILKVQKSLCWCEFSLLKYSIFNTFSSIFALCGRRLGSTSEDNLYSLDNRVCTKIKIYEIFNGTKRWWM